MVPKILVVEDDRLIAEDMVSTLTEAGYSDVILFHDSHAAIDYINGKENVLPDLALLDIELGSDKKGGFKVANALRDRAEIPIIIWSSKLDIHLKDATLDYYTFAEKSTNTAILLKNIEQAIFHYQKYHQVNRLDHIWLKWTVKGQHINSRVSISDIVYVESAGGNYTNVYTLDRPYMMIGGLRLKEFTNPYLYPDFFMIDESMVVNTKCRAMTGFSSTAVLVELPYNTKGLRSDNSFVKELKISRRRFAGFKDFMIDN